MKAKAEAQLQVRVICSGAAFIDIEELVPFQGAFKKLTPENYKRLRVQLLETGVAAAATVWKNKGKFFLLDGHQRREALMKMRAEGIKVNPIPVVFTECDNDEDARRKILALASTYGEVNEDFLQEFSQMAGVKLEALPMKYTFPEMDIKAFVAGIQNGGQNRDDDEGPLMIPVKPITKKGQAWQLGDHRILCGDSTNAEHFKLIMDKPAGLVVSSPPYNQDIKYRGFKDQKPKSDYLAFIGQVMKHCFAHTAAGRFICWNIGVNGKVFHVEQFLKLEEVGYQYHRQVCWYKPGIPKPTFQNSTKVRKYIPNYQHEMIYLFSKEAPAFGIDTKMPDEASCDVWRMSQSQSAQDVPGTEDAQGKQLKTPHPAMFPVKLPLLAIECLTEKGEIVLDCFGGAGSTLIAAERAGRHARLIEQDPLYVDVTVARWEKETGKKAKLLDLGKPIGFSRS